MSAMNRQSLRGHTELIILAALADRPMHGYALSESLKQKADASFAFGAGMLYPLLHKLERRTLIVGEWRRVLGADRRVYRLTRRGQKALAAKQREWREFRLLMTKLVNQPS